MEKTRVTQAHNKYNQYPVKLPEGYSGVTPSQEEYILPNFTSITPNTVASEWLPYGWMQGARMDKGQDGEATWNMGHNDENLHLAQL